MVARTWYRREPALILGLVNAVLAFILTVATDLDAEQIGSVLVISSGVLAVVTRQSVFSPATVARHLNTPGEPRPKP